MLRQHSFRDLPLVLSLVASVASWACGSPQKARDASAEPGLLAQEQLPGRPSLRTVERAVNGTTAVAIAVALDAPWANQALSASLLGKLRAARVTRATRSVSSSGFIVAATPGDSAQLKAFVELSRKVLFKPFQGPLPKAAPARLERSSAEKALAVCSGTWLAPKEAPSLAGIEQARRSVGVNRVSLALVGARAQIEELRALLRQAPRWGEDQAQPVRWQSAEHVGTGHLGSASQTLSVAVRFPGAAGALFAARKLGAPESLLIPLARSTRPGWEVTSITPVIQPDGGCLRIDLTPSRATESVSIPAALALSRWIANAVTDAGSSSKAGPWLLDDAALSEPHPLSAATATAWRGLSRPSNGGSPAVAVVLNEPVPTTPARALTEAWQQTAKPNAVIESVEQIDASTSVYEVLLATPCGTTTEGTRHAGRAALLHHTLARLSDGKHGVSLSPWVTPDGAGLLARTSRRSENESPDEIASRIAHVLSAGLLASLPPDAVAVTRHQLLARNPGSRDWSTLLEQLAPGYPSALAPMGTGSSLGEATLDAVEQERALFLRRPLRLAAVAPESAGSKRLIEDLNRTLQPLRSELSPCGTIPTLVPEAGLFEPMLNGPGRASALVGVSVDGAASWSPIDSAEILLFLLNRSGGYLEQEVVALGVAEQAVARLLGGRDTRALVVELHGADSDPEAAVQATRTVLQKLARGAISQAELGAALAFLKAYRAEAALSPGFAAVDLWFGRVAPKPPSLRQLKTWLARHLGEQRHSVVIPSLAP